MKLSTKGRYATRAMLELALHYGEGPVQVKEISRSQEISERYLEQILIPLKAAGLITVVRGAHGGFALARHPSGINIMEIVYIAEGSTTPVECLDDPRLCSRSKSCVTREVWAEMKNAADGVLKSITLQDLLDKQRKGVFLGDGI